MKINRKPLAELKNLNIIDFFEYGDEYDDFFGQRLDNGDQDESWEAIAELSKLNILMIYQTQKIFFQKENQRLNLLYF